MAIPSKKVAKLQHTGSQPLPSEAHPKNKHKIYQGKPGFQQKHKHSLPFLFGILSMAFGAGLVRCALLSLLLITSIAIICLAGIYFVQAPGEVLNDPIAYAAWVQQNALPRYGALTPIFDWMRFYTIFSSWYFMLLLTVLSLSIIVCTLIITQASGIILNIHSSGVMTISTRMQWRAFGILPIPMHLLQFNGHKITFTRGGIGFVCFKKKM